MTLNNLLETTLEKHSSKIDKIYRNYSVEIPSLPSWFHVIDCVILTKHKAILLVSFDDNREILDRNYSIMKSHLLDEPELLTHLGTGLDHYNLSNRLKVYLVSVSVDRLDNELESLFYSQKSSEDENVTPELIINILDKLNKNNSEV